MRGDGAIPAVELAYRLDLDDAEWLRAFAKLTCDSLGDPGMFSHAAIYRSHDRGFGYELRVCDPHDDAFLQAVNELEALNPKKISAQKYRATVCETASELARKHHLPGSFARTLLRYKLGKWGYVDVVQMQGAVLDDLAIGVTAGLRKPRVLPPRLRQTWARVGIHAAAGLRLRRTLRDPPKLLAAAGLVLERSGAIAHAGAEVASDKQLRETLRECARKVDHARGALATDAPDQAVELWQGLFEGRWTILEVFDTDGRGYLVACENDPEVAETRALTRRERQVLELASRDQADALIAYTLGISISSVQTHLTRALAKTGIASRARLVRAAATLAQRLDRNDSQNS